jgi:iron complex transport system permease protein
MKYLPARLDADARANAAIVLTAAALLALALLSLMLGRYPLSFDHLVALLAKAGRHAKGDAPTTEETIVYMVRLPRIVAAIMVGAGLSLAGSAYQTIFRNPIASPSLLGVSAGAGFGASLALLMRGSAVEIEIAAFIGGLCAVALSFTANRLIGGRSVVTLILCGMVMSALFQALISMVKFVADPVEVLASIAFWLLGGLSKINSQDAVAVSAPVICCAAILYAFRWRISVLALGETEAASLGVDVARLRLLVIICATLMSAATVCVAGIIGWVGLLVPPMARAAFGLAPGRLMLGSALGGAFFVLFVDDVARAAFVVEIPLGVLTALIGAPFFLFLLMRTRSDRWS